MEESFLLSHLYSGGLMQDWDGLHVWCMGELHNEVCVKDEGYNMEEEHSANCQNTLWTLLL